MIIHFDEQMLRKTGTFKAVFTLCILETPKRVL